MPPLLALCLTAGFVIWLFRRDFQEKPNVTGALWIPTLWLFIIGTRTVAQWLNLFGVASAGGSDDGGTPVDAATFFILILAGARVLVQRRVQLSEFMRQHQLLMLFLFYCLLSVMWADLPFIAFKRWIKILGHPIMALVLFTEPDPEEAIRRMMRRCAYVFFPVSVLFIKYYTELGRCYSPWGGPPMLTGITLDKNTLGCMTLIMGMFFFCDFLKAWNSEKSPERKKEIYLCGGFLLLVVLTLYYAKSSTSLVSMAVGCAAILFLGLPFVNYRNFAGYIIGIVAIVAVLEGVFGIYEVLLGLLGKDPTLTDRMPLWREVISMQPNPVIGAGFENFWTGERLATLWRAHWWQPRQAHNGYIETYLNLGLVGACLMVLLILNAFTRGCRSLAVNFNWSRFRLGFVIAFIFYNYTEAAFKALHPVWFVFYIVAIDFGLARAEKTAPVVDAGMPADSELA